MNGDIGEILVQAGVIVGNVAGRYVNTLHERFKTESIFPIAQSHERVNEAGEAIISPTEEQKIEAMTRQLLAEPDLEKRKQLRDKLTKEHMLAKAQSPLQALMIESMNETDENKKRKLKMRMIGAAFMEIYVSRPITRIKSEFKKHPRASRFLSSTVTPLALTGSLIGGSAAALWTTSENSASAPQPQAPIELVIDHTAAPLLDGNLSKINELTAAFGNDSKFNVQILPAGHSDSAPVPETVAEALKDPAYGSEPFDDTIQNAIGRKAESSSAVVLITDDDGLESPATIT
ncbi:MAG: hypothetical protein ACREF7_00810, partial [Candidatus Saccharimonadales bacterium]